MKSFRAFEQAVFSKVLNESEAYRRRQEEAEPLGGEGNGDANSPSRAAAIPQPQEIADAMESVLQEGVVGLFSNLQEAVDR